jgi:hypothetical protein
MTKSFQTLAPLSDTALIVRRPASGRLIADLVAGDRP